jgi:hypothetical protein
MVPQAQAAAIVSTFSDAATAVTADLSAVAPQRLAF